MLGIPVTGFPDWPTMGITSRIRMALPSVLTLRITGLNSGTQKVRRFFPSTLICPFGPRSVIIPNSPGASLGPCQRSLPAAPKENLVIVGNAFRKKHVLKCLKRRSGEGIDADDFVLRRDWLRQQKSH